MSRNLRSSAPILLVVVFGLAFVLGGCVHSRERHHSASVVDFLYPNTKKPATVAPGVPVLALPIRVGIAFVPSSGSGYYRHSTLSEAQKTGLLQQVADYFKKYPFVKDIELIPSAYLRPQGSFANLDQIRTMFGVDVIALVSYDQVQFTDQSFLGLTYWTIVGAYIVPAEKNDTHTMVDTVVYDIASRKMLFRAPGNNLVKGVSTPVNLSEQLRLDSGTGLNEATKEMIANLDQQLALFKDKVKQRPTEYRVVHTPGYTGGGSVDGLLVMLMIMLAGAFVWLRRHES